MYIVTCMEFWMTRFIGLFNIGRDYALQFTITHTLASTVTSSLAVVW
jgi:hypothetical protein